MPGLADAGGSVVGAQCTGRSVCVMGERWLGLLMSALQSLNAIQNWAAFRLEAFSCCVGRREAGKMLRGYCRGAVKGQVRRDGER